MNVIVENEQQELLSNIDIDVIKSISGSYDVHEIINMFKDFFYSKMILDVTAIKQYKDVRTYEILARGLDVQKIIFLLPDKSSLCTPNFLSHLISLGIYNFTSKLSGIKYLLKKSNTLQDVEHIRNMASVVNSNVSGAAVARVPKKETTGTKIIGFRNVTDHAGATTLIYMLKKELTVRFGHDNVVAIEVDKNDFQLFGEKSMVSTREGDIIRTVSQYSNADILLIDLNKCQDDSFCTDIVYLVEPSTVRLNGLVRKHKDAFTKLLNQKVVLNQSMLLNSDIFDFESEAGIKVFYNLPPLDERKKNSVILDLLLS